MDNISKDFQNIDMQHLAKLAQSDTAKQLMSMVGSSNDPKVRSAMDHAAAGDMTEAKQLIQKLIEDPKARALLEMLTGGNHG